MLMRPVMISSSWRMIPVRGVWRIASSSSRHELNQMYLKRGYYLKALSSNSSVMEGSFDKGSSHRWNVGRFSNMKLLMALGLSGLFASERLSHCEGPYDFSESDDDDDEDEDTSKLPVYKLSDIALRNGQGGRPIWMTYGGCVYDVTNFVVNHPGGSEKIMEAAGGPIEPYWNIYRQHFSSDLPMRLMEKMVIGQLDLNEQEQIDEMMEQEAESDPYRHEPARYHLLKIHSEQPMNAEVPTPFIAKSYLTPNPLHYIRNHHPVPYFTPQDSQKFRLKIDLTALNRKPIKLSLKDLQSLPHVEITSTLQCSGNRRSHFNKVKRTSGTGWDQGAISTAKWKGPRLCDVLKLAGLDVERASRLALDHVCFESIDGFKASIPIEKAASYHGDCIIALEMNGEPLPRDHGYPVRVIVPGYAAVRNVKWVDKIELSESEAEGPFQRGLNYKVLPTNVTDVKDVDLRKMPSIMEASLFSGITKLERLDENLHTKPGDVVFVKAKGWAWAGGGRNIARVDLTGDDGETWTSAEVTMGGNQKFQRAWAWVFWECEKVPAVVRSDGTVEVCSKALDIAMNVQPEKCDHMWNLRGLGNNSWFRSSMSVA